MTAEEIRTQLYNQGHFIDARAATEDALQHADGSEVAELQALMAWCCYRAEEWNSLCSGQSDQVSQQRGRRNATFHSSRITQSSQMTCNCVT